MGRRGLLQGAGRISQKVVRALTSGRPYKIFLGISPILVFSRHLFFAGSQTASYLVLKQSALGSIISSLRAAKKGRPDCHPRELCHIGLTSAAWQPASYNNNYFAVTACTTAILLFPIRHGFRLLLH